jgi:hypothetical protein
MTDKTDIVARLRAYTQDNSPVLSSDLKEAADEIQVLRSTAVQNGDTYHKLLCHLFYSVSASLERPAPPLNSGTVGALIGAVKEMRDEVVEWRSQAITSPPRRPGESQPTGGFAERMNELDARIARLESSVRLTERRLMLAAASMYDSVRKDPTPRSVANRIHDALMATSEDRFADYGVPK